MKLSEYKKQEVDINELPLYILRGIDIDSPEEEEEVQNAVSNKLLDLPPEQVVYINDIIKEMDALGSNMTPEKELEFQKMIDERMNKAKGIKSLDEQIEEANEELEDIQKEIEVEKPKKFCEFCDSKGVRHKSNCTRSK